MRRCLALLLLLAAPAWAATPEPSPDELRFITANAEFTLLHEMGHLLISELQLPVLGREEDAADHKRVLEQSQRVHRLSPMPDAAPGSASDLPSSWRCCWP